MVQPLPYYQHPEMGLSEGVFGGDSDGLWKKFMWKAGTEAVFITSPDEEAIIDVPPPAHGPWSGGQHAFLLVYS